MLESLNLLHQVQTMKMTEAFHVFRYMTLPLLMREMGLSNSFPFPFLGLDGSDPSAIQIEKKIRMTNSNLEMAKKVGDKLHSFRGIQLFNFNLKSVNPQHMRKTRMSI